MHLNRRTLLKLGIAATSGVAAPALAAQEPQTAKEKPASSPDYVGVLVDTTLCIGCRKCEEACNRRNHLPRTAESFSDRDVLRSFRRPTETAFTVVNQFPGRPSPDQAGLPQTYCKVQCMHCLYPSCVSACIVGALTKSADGAVVYNPTICIGCRYCQVACPFEIPAYEFHVALTPRVRKCEFCADQAKGTGADPACAASCHIGYGWVDAKYDFTNPTNIDCLVCHDTTGTYRKDPGKGGLPEPSLDLAAIAKKIGRPSRQACGSCHFASGGAPYAKHGDLEPVLANPPADFDLHMGTLKMRCQDCHATTEHRIAGMSMSAPAVEGRVRCEKCHGQNPHGVVGALSRHLDDHVRAVACETCHIPFIANASRNSAR